MSTRFARAGTLPAGPRTDSRCRSHRARTRTIASLAALAAIATGATPATAHTAAAHAAPAGPLRPLVTAATVAAAPLAFEPNRGQADAGIGFLAHGRDYSVSLSPSGMALAVGGGSAPVQMTLFGADAGATGRGEGLLPGTVGYASAEGTTPALAAIRTYAAVRYTAVYPGVDLRYYGSQGHLEYDFAVAPGADPGRIQLAFRGTEQPRIAPDGDLILRTSGGDLLEHRPVIYQLVHGAHRVGGGYALDGHIVRFRLGTYDHRLPLVIDPVLVYSTYFGGKGDDAAAGIAVDGQGSVTIAGTTLSGASTRMAFISRLDPSGRHVLYTRYISNIYSDHKTACDTMGAGIAVDGHGNAYVTGTYGYEDEFNLCNNEAVLWARVDTAGKLTVDIFGKYGGNRGKAIAVDGAGNSYITGATDQWEANFPVTQGAFQIKPGIQKAQEGLAGDAFVLKIDPSGQEVYGTFLGGSYIDGGLGIAVDHQGDAYVVGTAGSSNFPITTNAFQQRRGNPYAAGFLSIVSADGSSLLYSTFLSGNNGEDLTGVAVGGQGLAYVVGSSDSRDFPTTANAYKRTCGGDGLCDINKTWYTDYGSNTDYWHINVAEDVVVAVIDPRLSGADSLRYSTFLGGRGRDLGTAIAVDTSGRAYVTGRTAAADFPGAQSITGTSYDALVSVIDPRQSGTRSLVFSAAFGGNGYDEGDGIALDRAGDVYIAGQTNSRDFPTQRALQSANAGGYDAFIVKIGGMPRP